MPEIDPNNFDPALLMTTAGAMVAATIIANIIQVLKRAGPLGEWIDNKREPAVALLLSVLVVGYAYAVTEPNPLDPVRAFQGVLAWLGVAMLSTKAKDIGAVVPTA